MLGVIRTFSEVRFHDDVGAYRLVKLGGAALGWAGMTGLYCR